MNFLDEVNQALEERNAKLKEVSSKTAEWSKEIKEKKEQIKVLEEGFKVNFDVTVTDKINTLNDEITKLQSNVNTFGKAFEYTLRVNPSNDVVADLDKKSDELSLEELRDNIVKSQKDYLNYLKEYKDKTSDLRAFRMEIVKAEKNIDPDAIKIIDDWFKKKSPEL